MELLNDHSDYSGPTSYPKGNNILIKVTTKEYEGYREIIEITKKHGDVEKIKMDEEEEETSNPRPTVYIKYNQKEDMNRTQIGMKEEKKIGEITAIEEKKIDMKGAVDKDVIYHRTNRTQIKKPAQWILLWYKEGRKNSIKAKDYLGS